jgi:acetylornithine deacetylase
MILNEQFVSDSIGLLKSMIAIPSLSREEHEVAEMIEKQLCSWGYQPSRIGNNLWLKSRNWDRYKPTVLLNSHIDTVRPANGWRNDPYKPTEENGKITGLGSNDAGASVVALLAAFRHLDRVDQPYNYIFCASAEEEVSGLNGIVSVLDQFGKLDLVIVGEPTGMQMAIAEKGLLVLDCDAKGKAGHAARNEGENAIYKAIKDIEILKDYRFPLESELLGHVKLTVTQIEGGHQHNVVPDTCHFVVDVRTNEFYSNQETFQIISGLISSEVKARSFRLNSSGIKPEHPLVKRGLSMGLKTYGSPTTSDQAVIPYPSIKIGPGDSARSHTADEYIYEDEIRDGIAVYVRLLDQLKTV